MLSALSPSLDKVKNYQKASPNQFSVPLRGREIQSKTDDSFSAILLY